MNVNESGTENYLLSFLVSANVLIIVALAVAWMVEPPPSTPTALQDVRPRVNPLPGTSGWLMDAPNQEQVA